MEQKTSKSKATNINRSIQIFNTSSRLQDPTFLTEEEYLEMTVQEFINTPFHEYLMSCLKKKSSKNTILSLLAHIKDNEIDIMKVYNINFEINRKFIADSEFRNTTIEKYKKPRGFPLKLRPVESQLYSMEDGITLSVIEKLKNEKEKEKQVQDLHRTRVEEDFSSNSFSIDTDSCEDEIPFNIQPNRIRMSNPEKRSSKFDPLCPLRLMKNQGEKDQDMSDEESKSEISREEQSERPSLGSFSAFITGNMNQNTDALDS